jgi:hypothetical protein
MTDRSQGVASILDGQIEVMLQRRLLYDDGYVLQALQKNQLKIHNLKIFKPRST